MPKQQAKQTITALKEKAIEAAFSLAAEIGWEQTGLKEIAEKSGISLSELYELFDDRFDILSSYGRILDRRVLEAIGEPDPDITPRDRLFDILMERFDLLNERRDGIVAILQSFRYDPKQAVISLPHLCRSMNWMLEGAGIDTGGIKGAIKVTGLTALYLNTLRTWKDDYSEDMAQTMAALDRNLGRAEQWVSSLNLVSKQEFD